MNLRWLFLAYSGLFVFGVSDSIRGPIFPELLLHFDVNHAQGAWFFVLVSLTSVLTSVISPMLISKWGHIVVLRRALISMTLSQVIFATAPSFYFVLVGSVLYGAGAGCLGVVQNVMVLLGSEVRYHQKFQSALHACYGAASIIAPMIVIAVTFLGFSWQASFWVSGVMILILYFLSYISWSPLGDSPSQIPDKKMNIRSHWTLEEYYLAFIIAIYVGLEVLIATRMASYLRETLFIDLKQSSLWVMIFFSGLLIGRLYFVFRQPKRSLQFQTIMSMGLLIVVLGLSLSHWSLWIVLAGLFIAPFYPVMMTAVGVLFPQRIEENLSLCNALQGAVLVGMHGITGIISDWGGLRAAMVFGLILSLITVSLLTFYSRIFKRGF